MSKWYMAGFPHEDAMRTKAEKAFGNLSDASRANIKQTDSAVDETPVRRYAAGGHAEKKSMGGTMRNERDGGMSEGEGKLMKGLKQERGSKLPVDTRESVRGKMPMRDGGSAKNTGMNVIRKTGGMPPMAKGGPAKKGCK